MKIFLRLFLISLALVLFDNCNEKKPAETSEAIAADLLGQKWQHVSDSSAKWSYGLMEFFNVSKEFNSNAEPEIRRLMSESFGEQRKLTILQKENADNMAHLWRLIKEWETFRTEFDMKYIQYQNLENEPGTPRDYSEAQIKWLSCLDSMSYKMTYKFSGYLVLKEKTERDMKELDSLLRINN